MSTVLFAVTDAVTADAFLRPHLAAASAAGHRTCLMSKDGPLLREVAEDVGACPVPVPLTRNPALLRDLRALSETVRQLRAIRPDTVHVGTPKAGLVVGLSAWLTRVPRRIYVLHGLRFESTSGLRRRMLTLLERVACRTATTVVAVSESVRGAAVAEGLGGLDRIRVLGQGSISGVDASRFARDPQRGLEFRARHGIAASAPVALFVGRLSLDKGIGELREAWAQVVACHPDARLVVVGGSDPAQPAAAAVVAALRADPSVVMAGELPDPAPAYSAADLQLLPTYREGFGTVILEAAAAGVPTVASAVTGCRDAVQDGVTGVLVPPRDPRALAEVVVRLIGDPGQRAALGRSARERALRDFCPHDVVARYTELLR